MVAAAVRPSSDVGPTTMNAAPCPAAMPAPPPITVSSWKLPANTPPTNAAEIIAQVEYYFSDQNLRQDAHLLGMAGGDPMGPVNLKHIMSFNKMKKFKPMSAVRDALRHSNMVEVTPDNKHVRRKHSMKVSLLVKPRLDPNRQRKAELAEIGLTKKMAEPTGFEDNATNGPLTPAEYEQDRQDYDPELGFCTCLENAVNKFNVRRKMHSNTRHIFEKFITFGGLDMNTGVFQGGPSKVEMKKQGVDKEEIERLSAHFSVPDYISNSLFAQEEGRVDEVTWTVDFMKVAKAFLSSEFLESFDWYDEKQVKTATKVLSNFYKFLLYHDVFPEYQKEIKACLDFCPVAEEELLKLGWVDRTLPGDFNAACSTICRHLSICRVSQARRRRQRVGQLGRQHWVV
jgi:hypothetical protein